VPSDPVTLIIALAAVLLALAGLVVGVVALLRSRRPQSPAGDSPIERLTAALQAGDEEAAARELVDYLGAVHERLGQLGAEVAALRERAERPLQRLGMVHFDAADDIAGHMSCALAVLDGDRNGFLITSLYTRERSRTFVRRVAAGKTQHELLPEEAEALAQALGRKE